MKTFLIITASGIAILNLWLAPKIYRLAKTQPDDPNYFQSHSKLKLLEKISRGSSLLLLTLVVAILAIGNISFG